MSDPIEAMAEARRLASAAREAADAAIGARMRDLCDTLLTYRNDLGMTQQDIADAIGISRPQVANIEAGRGVSVESLIGYAAAVGCSVEVSKKGSQP